MNVKFPKSGSVNFGGDNQTLRLCRKPIGHPFQTQTSYAAPIGFCRSWRNIAISNNVGSVKYVFEGGWPGVLISPTPRYRGCPVLAFFARAGVGNAGSEGSDYAAGA